MKSMTTKFIMAAAALAIATGVATAQTYRVDIPFAFRAGDHVMSRGITPCDSATLGRER